MIFKCETSQANHIKTLITMLAINIKHGNFKLCKRGLFLVQDEPDCSKLFKISLLAENFTDFVYSYKEEAFYFSLNLNSLKILLQPITNKDVIEIKIPSTTEITIIIHHKEQERTSVSRQNIQIAQNVEFDPIDNYEDIINIPSKEFQQMCKNMTSIGRTIKVTTTGKKLEFSCVSEGDFSRNVIFGKNSDESIIPYTKEYTLLDFLRINKMISLAPYLIIQNNKNLPILFKILIGSLGTLKIFIHEI